MVREHRKRREPHQITTGVEIRNSVSACLRIRSGESAGVVFENRRGAYVEYASTGSAENRVGWPPE